MYNDNIIHIAADAGKIMLENGGETYRVEQTITMICKAYTVKNVDNFVTPNFLLLSITNENGNAITTVRRLATKTVNLEKVALVNNLSRNIYSKSLTLKDIRNELTAIDKLPKYGPKLTTFISALSAGFFALLFGGSLKDFPISFFIGMLISLISILFDKYEVNGFFTNVFGGLLASFIAVTINYMIPIFNVDKVIIGAIMLLVPGMLITNAIRDTLSGHIFSGMFRSLEAFLIAAGIAIGTALGFKLAFMFLGGAI